MALDQGIAHTASYIIPQILPRITCLTTMQRIGMAGLIEVLFAISACSQMAVAPIMYVPIIEYIELLAKILQTRASPDEWAGAAESIIVIDNRAASAVDPKPAPLSWKVLHRHLGAPRLPKSSLPTISHMCKPRATLSDY